MTIEFLCWCLCVLFGLWTLMINAMTVAPEAQTTAAIANLVTLIATFAFGVLAIGSRRTIRQPHLWTRAGIILMGVILLIVSFFSLG